jgi:hypothetical protein
MINQILEHQTYILYRTLNTLFTALSSSCTMSTTKNVNSMEGHFKVLYIIFIPKNHNTTVYTKNNSLLYSQKIINIVTICI